MRFAALAAPAALLALAAALTTGCVSEQVTIQGTVPLGAGGRAEGRLDLPAGVEASVTFRNDGPGRADFAVKDGAGKVLQEGAIGDATVRVVSDEDQTIVLVLEAFEDAGTAVLVTLRAAGRVRIGWDLSRAVPRRDPAAPPP